MKRWTLVLTALGLYAAVLVATAPATLIDRGLRDASQGRMRLAQATGTLWSGAGQVQSRDPRGRAGLSEGVKWRLRGIHPWPPGLAFRVELDSGLRAFPLGLSWSELEVADAEFSLPAAALGQLLPQLAPLGLSGEAYVQIPRIAIGTGSVRGDAALQWRKAGSALTPVSPLGDYELRIQAHGTNGRSSLTTLQGPLQLDGQGSWSQDQKSQFLATARMPPPLQPQLAPFLRLVAVEQGDGSFQWRLK